MISWVGWVKIHLQKSWKLWKISLQVVRARCELPESEVVLTRIGWSEETWYEKEVLVLVKMSWHFAPWGKHTYYFAPGAWVWKTKRLIFFEFDTGHLGWIQAMIEVMKYFRWFFSSNHVFFESFWISSGLSFLVGLGAATNVCSSKSVYLQKAVTRPRSCGKFSDTK